LSVNPTLKAILFFLAWHLNLHIPPRRQTVVPLFEALSRQTDWRIRHFEALPARSPLQLAPPSSPDGRRAMFGPWIAGSTLNCHHRTTLFRGAKVLISTADDFHLAIVLESHLFREMLLLWSNLRCAQNTLVMKVGRRPEFCM